MYLSTPGKSHVSCLMSVRRFPLRRRRTKRAAKGSSQPRDQTQRSRLQVDSLPEPPGKCVYVYTYIYAATAAAKYTSWETYMQIRKQQLELDMEQQTGSK